MTIKADSSSVTIYDRVNEIVSYSRSFSRSELTGRDYVDEGVPVIRGGNLPEDRIFYDDDFVYVREEKADQLVPNMAYPGDVIFTQRGTLGQVGLIPTEPRFSRYVVSQSQMKLTVDPDKADAKFVYYYFRHPDTVQVVKNRALTSGVPHINLGILRDFEIPLHPPHTQREIVRILSAYDDLIETLIALHQQGYEFCESGAVVGAARLSKVPSLFTFGAVEENSRTNRTRQPPPRTFLRAA